MLLVKVSDGFGKCLDHFIPSRVHILLHHNVVEGFLIIQAAAGVVGVSFSYDRS